MTAIRVDNGAPSRTKRPATKRSTKRRLFAGFRYGMLSLWVLIVAFPIFWMVSTSFKPDKEWYANPPVYVSKTPTLGNFLSVWTSRSDVLKTQEAESMQRPWVALRNSLVVAMLATTLSVGFGAILAYGVSRHRILSEVRMFQLLVLRMIPPIVVAAPLSLYYSTLGLLDTITGLVIV